MVTVVIDDSFPGLAPRLEQAIATFADIPATFVLNTHYHDLQSTPALPELRRGPLRSLGCSH